MADVVVFVAVTAVECRGERCVCVGVVGGARMIKSTFFVNCC